MWRVVEGGAKVVVCRQVCGVSVKHRARTNGGCEVSVGRRVRRVWTVFEALQYVNIIYEDVFLYL